MVDGDTPTRRAKAVTVSPVDARYAESCAIPPLFAQDANSLQELFARRALLFSHMARESCLMGRARKRDTKPGDATPNRLREARGEPSIEQLLADYAARGGDIERLPSVSTIARYETMEVEIPRNRLNYLADAYGISAEAIYVAPEIAAPAEPNGGEQAASFVLMPVQFPSQAEMAEMMRGLLQASGFPNAEAAQYEKLARLFLDSIAQSGFPHQMRPNVGRQLNRGQRARRSGP